MNALERDQQFLQRKRVQVVRPLGDVAGAERVLFSPGLGLGLGDQFMCRPLLAALCHRFPHARIDLLTDSSSFWESRVPARVTLIPRNSEDSGGVVDVLASGYDLALLGYHPGCLEELAAVRSSTVFCAGTNLALFRAFHACEGACRELPLTLCHSAVNEADRFVALFRDFGVWDPLDRLWPSQHIARLPVPTAVPAEICEARILIHPGTGKPYKSWPLEKWGDLAAKLVGRGAAVTVSAGTSDEDGRMAAAVVQAAPGACLAPRLPLDAFLDRLDAYDFVLSSDTFLPHAVAAQGRSISVAVYGPTDPARYCPPGPRNFFITPIEARPEDLLEAIEGVVRLVSGNLEDLAVRGGEAGLLRSARHLMDLMQDANCPANATESLLRELREGIREPYRAVLAGDEAQHLRMLDSIERHSLSRALESPVFAPVWRVARSLASASLKMSAGARAGADHEEIRRVESL